MVYRGRFAPSPTGDLHLGSAAACLFAAARARQHDGQLILRLEDLDAPRVVVGAEQSQLDDLAWLGFRFTEGPSEGGAHGPYRQSERSSRYQAAIDALAQRGLVYFCDCSRKEVQLAASAPHLGEEGPRYPGTCRPFGMARRSFRRPPAVRLAVQPGDIAFRCAIRGPATEDVSEQVGDFVLKRGDGVFAYQLAVVVDDLAMRVSEVVRGVDLAPSRGRQALLARLLGAEQPPQTFHLALLVDAEGERFSKRQQSLSVRQLRARGVSLTSLWRTLCSAYEVQTDGVDPVADLARYLCDHAGAGFPYAQPSVVLGLAGDWS